MKLPETGGGFILRQCAFIPNTKPERRKVWEPLLETLENALCSSTSVVTVLGLCYCFPKIRIIKLQSYCSLPPLTRVGLTSVQHRPLCLFSLEQQHNQSGTWHLAQDKVPFRCKTKATIKKTSWKYKMCKFIKYYIPIICDLEHGDNFMQLTTVTCP